MSFRVDFVHGLQRHRMTRAGHTYDTQRNVVDKAEIAARYRNACHASPRSRPTCAPRRVPVAVDVYVQRPLPMSRPKRCDGEHDTYKPDADNVAKLVLDALSGVAYEDDAQVVRVCVTKARRRRGVDEHMTVTIRRPDWGDRQEERWQRRKRWTSSSGTSRRSPGWCRKTGTWRCSRAPSC